MANSTPKYYLKTYGCQMNLADSERIAGWYEGKGWRKAKKIQEADEVVIVSCSVRQSADNRVFGLVNNLIKFKNLKAKVKKTTEKSKVPEPRIILTGCMLRYPRWWLEKKLPGVAEFKKVSEYPRKTKSKRHNPAIHAYNRFAKTPHFSAGDEPARHRLRHQALAGGPARHRLRHQVLAGGGKARFQASTEAYIPIMEGCNNYCSYCVVPYARGRERSRPFEEIFGEVEELAKRGYEEITLLGQNVNSYGKDINNFKSISKGLNSKIKYETPFAILLERLHQIPGIEKISFLTSNPWDLDLEIIEAMSLPKIDRYLHLPVQSGDDEILKKMNRKYSVRQYVELVGKIRKRIPDIRIGTDIIVGFPGETEEQFQNTVDLCKKLGFTKAYIARYSPRLQTAAYMFKDNVPYEEKKRRWQILEELINENKGIF